MSPSVRSLLLLGATPALLLACSLNPQPLPPGEQPDGALAGPADATTGDGNGLFNGADGATDAGSDTTQNPSSPDGGTDAAGDAPEDAPSNEDAPADGPAEEGG